MKKLFKIIKIIMVILFAMSLILSSIVSQNSYHIETCEEEHCEICSIIHISKIITILTVTIFLCVFVGVLIYFFLSRLHKDKEKFMQQSLVFQKVQLNE